MDLGPGPGRYNIENPPPPAAIVRRQQLALEVPRPGWRAMVRAALLITVVGPLRWLMTGLMMAWPAMITIVWALSLPSGAALKGVVAIIGSLASAAWMFYRFAVLGGAARGLTEVITDRARLIVAEEQKPAGDGALSLADEGDGKPPLRLVG